MRLRLRVLLLVVALLAFALIVFGQWRSAPAAVEHSAAPTTATPKATGLAPSVSPSATLSPTVAQPAPSVSPSPTEPPKVVIAPAAPESITIPELEFTVTVQAETVEVMAAAYNRSHPGESVKRMVYASRFDMASWPSNWRGTPGTDSQETVYLTCHSNSKAWSPCNELAKEGVVQAGQHLVLTTHNGDVRYVLNQPVLADKLALTDDPRVQSNQPGRVILMVCMLSDDGRRTQKTWLFTGQLER